MLNDTIDILDANVINLQIKFKIAAYANVNKYNALDTAKKDIVSFFNNRVGYEIGEPFKITDIYSVLKNSAAVLDAIDVEVSVKSGGDYADSNFDIEANKSADGRKIFCPQDSIFNVKFPNADIIGTVV